MGPLNAGQENQHMSCYSLTIKLMFCEGVAPKAKIRNSGFTSIFKLLQIGKLKKLGPLNAGEKFINSKKDVMIVTAQ